MEPQLKWHKEHGFLDSQVFSGMESQEDPKSFSIKLTKLQINTIY